MKFFYILFVMVSMLFAAGGNAPSRVAVDGAYEAKEAESYSGVSMYSLIDTVDTDSAKILNRYGPKTHKGWEDILVTKSISGGDSATAIVTVVVDAYDKNDSLISSTIVDTFSTATGGAILVPFYQKPGYFGDYFNVWLKSSAEAKIKGFWHFQRRIKQISNSAK